ncbi:MAG: phosphoribosylformylglycinamidine synthase [Candidatus Wallbacteria bacterium GWC2_49_35]|uniref:Phosphoribosylformylglycinamidine synthase subunit PurL n=1 Tax=Candidatus Wallbacteria bacterium GWC2_49_35 TaxID=1817813 RepID=A0A1F7WK53_9BACT|nr:MAG: phosphoribosylformylglycinamidine synthase [Candidatus Wallbacteria bacterium GWC2_49_35]
MKKPFHIELILKQGVRDVEGEKIAARSLKYLGIATGAVKTGKIFTVCYELCARELEKFANKGLKDEIIHDVYAGSFYDAGSYRTYVFAAKLPGVTDDEGMSAQKTLCDISGLDIGMETQHIFTGAIYHFENELTDGQLKKIAHELLGNPLVNHFEFGRFDGTINYVPQVSIKNDDRVENIDIFVSDEKLECISKERILSLDVDEMKAIRSHYSAPGTAGKRKEAGLSELPTDCELEIIAQTWSEHCKHKEFNAIIEYEDHDTGEKKTIDSLFNTYIKGSTEKIMKKLAAAGRNWLVKVFSDNAGVVKIDKNNVLAWKVETHNSPSAIDPYGGAITGILGNNRDPLGTGRGGGRLLFNTNVLCFGPPDYSKELLPGQLHPKRIFEGVTHGIMDGGNKSGVPTVNGSIIFDERYSGKPLVFCGTGGVMPASYNGLNSWDKEASAGDLIIMAGGRVGKDGIHGATFSSAAIDENSPASAVQIGSPITQKMLSDFLEVACAGGLVKCSTDNGAGGLSSSVGELAELFGGAEVELTRVPLKYCGLRPWEIFISESQERMTLVVEPEKLGRLGELARKFEVEISEIGRFTRDGNLNVRHDGKIIASLDLKFLHHGVPRKRLIARWSRPRLSEPEIAETKRYDRLLLELVKSLNICSRERVIRFYDHEVKGKTIIKPLMGTTGLAPQDAAVVRLNFDSYEAVAISNGIMPKFGDIDPYDMSSGSFDEAIRQIIAVGGKLPLHSDSEYNFWSVNDNFCVPDSVYDAVKNPDGDVKLAKLVRMCEALYDMSTFYNIPMTSGKDSMKNDFYGNGKKISVPPTVLYSIAARIDDIRKTVTSDFKCPSDLIYVLGKTFDELGGSEFYRLLGHVGANVPKVRRKDAMELYLKVMSSNDAGLIESCHDISDGGMAVALAECLFGSMQGADIEIPTSEAGLNAELFSESHSRFVVSIRAENRDKFEDVMGDFGRFLGKVTAEAKLKIRYRGNTIVDVETAALINEWKNGLVF